MVRIEPYGVFAMVILLLFRWITSLAAMDWKRVSGSAWFVKMMLIKSNMLMILFGSL